MAKKTGAADKKLVRFMVALATDDAVKARFQKNKKKTLTAAGLSKKAIDAIMAGDQNAVAERLGLIEQFPRPRARSGRDKIEQFPGPGRTNRAKIEQFPGPRRRRNAGKIEQFPITAGKKKKAKR